MKTFNSKGQDLGGNSIGSLFQKCFSKLQHDFSMFLFADKIWDDQLKKLIHQFSGGIPFILKSPFRVMFGSVFMEKIAAKFGVNPFHKFLIGVNDLKAWKIINCIRSLSRLDIYRSFSVDNPGKVRKLCNSPHVVSFLGRLYQKEVLLATLND